jgi:hypothetical protein
MTREIQAMLDSKSLMQTVNAVNDAFFFNERIPSKTRDGLARWIAGRQGLSGSYSNMFAPTDSDMKRGVRLFTGEALGPSASLRHVSGEEACRALVLLGSRAKDVTSALERATAGLLQALERAKAKERKMFCCGTCDPALWRHITAGAPKGSEEWLVRGLAALKSHRAPTGEWHRFPFYYTLLALSEIDLPQASQEIRYAAEACEAHLPRLKGSTVVHRRRRTLIERVLSKC